MRKVKKSGCIGEKYGEGQVYIFPSLGKLVWGWVEGEREDMNMQTGHEEKKGYMFDDSWDSIKCLVPVGVVILACGDDEKVW